MTGNQPERSTGESPAPDVAESPRRIVQILRRELRTKRRPQVSLIFTFWLVFVWVAVFGSITPLSILGGLIVAVVVELLLPLPRRPKYFWFRPLQSIYLVLRFIWDLMRAGTHVSLLVLFPRPRLDAIIRCPVKSDVPEYLTILAAMTSMIPGTIVVRIDRKKRFVYLHSLDIEKQGGVEGIRKATEAQEERILRAVAPASILRELNLSAWGKSDQVGLKTDSDPEKGLIQLEVADD